MKMSKDTESGLTGLRMSAVRINFTTLAKVRKVIYRMHKNLIFNFFEGKIFGTTLIRLQY